jgi:uncharacterized membrane protein (UPF0127 family)
MILQNATTGTILAKRVKRAVTPWRRIVGWLHRSSISTEEGLLFERCNAIHTIGMRTAIDVLFLDELLCISDIVPNVEPGRLHVAKDDAHSVLEMGPGFIAEHDVLVGDRLMLAGDLRASDV